MFSLFLLPLFERRLTGRGSGTTEIFISNQVMYVFTDAASALTEERTTRTPEPGQWSQMRSESTAAPNMNPG